jgi:4-hydroxy-tetrahydrodipicolinate reductase
MKIAILGYGKMGKEIEIIARERDHQVVLIIDAVNMDELTPGNLGKADAAIDFSTPGSAYQNILRCIEAGTPVVCGTTGWLDRYEEVKDFCSVKGGSFFYASNFSLGMNVLFALNRYLTRMMNAFPEYEVGIREIHHVHKLDAPSGTAITLANDLIKELDRKSTWELNRQSDRASVRIDAFREGEVPGTHIITWDSPVDSIEISHMAKSRKGLALGAMLAAEFIVGKKGIFGMADLLKLS